MSVPPATRADATTETYRWSWDRDSDVFTVRDRRNRLVAGAPLQPAVLVADADGVRRCSPGQAAHVRSDRDGLQLTYLGVNGDAEVDVAVRFERTHLRFEPLRYRGRDRDRVVSTHYFAVAAVVPVPALRHTYLVQPGICESPALSPLLPTEVGLKFTSWLGRGSMGSHSEVYQQWGLPTHYFCGATRDAGHNARGSQAEMMSGAFCCGLGDLPAADLMLELGDGCVSPVFVTRDDLWPETGTVEQTLGGPLLLTVAEDYREAIRAYYRVVREELGVRRPHRPSEVARTVTAAQFNTWGAQCAGEAVAGRFDQAQLEQIYADLRSCGMRPELFVIDDKWEGAYGELRHDPVRFPDFDGFLRRVRADGHRIGMWAAFLRTNDPSSIGLNPSHLMKDRTGVPIEKNNDFAREPYYLYDITQPEVQQALARQITTFVHRYNPDLVKFDFGYELPSLELSRPADPTQAGERLLSCALEFLTGALRSANPNIALMYYSLSPLIAPYIDQHSHDDMYLAVGDYHTENNRRLFFSSLLGELGVPVYCSGGYSWDTMRRLWFDSAIAGPVGSLNSFRGDENGDRPTTELAAWYNGLRAITRRTSVFHLVPLDPVTLNSSSGAHSGSWFRYEGAALTAAAVRAVDADHTDRVAGLRTGADLVVASLDDEPMSRTRRLGIVAFGAGELTIRRDASITRCTAVYHWHDGTDTTTTVPIPDGPTVTVALDQTRDSQVPLSWLEVVCEC
jgi:hypothetical protein